jgi:hypothetical protein
MPPIRIETSDSVCISTPVAPSDTSIPLALQIRVLGDVWSRRADEKLDRHAFAVLVELAFDDFADGQPPEEDGHADIMRTEVGGAQYEFSPGLLARDDRRHVEGDEIAPLLR